MLQAERSGEAGDGAVIRARLQTKGGDVRTVVASATRLKLGRRRYLLDVFRDTSEEVELQAQLQQAQKMESIALLAGSVVHDFNNLLQVITNYTDLALTGMPESAGARKDLREITGAAERAAALVRQLLTFSRRGETAPEPLDLMQVIDVLTSILRRVIGEHLELHVAHGEGPKAIHAAPSQVEQVLMNLCVNARDAMPHGGRIEIRTQGSAGRPNDRAEGRFVRMSVSDTGIGMPPGMVERIFEPFFTTKDAGSRCACST